VNFHGEKRSNRTHESTTDPDARLARKAQWQGSKAELHRKSAYRKPQRLILDTDLRAKQPGTAERDAGTGHGGAGGRGRGLRWAGTRVTIPKTLCRMPPNGVTPPCERECEPTRRQRYDGRTTRHPGHAISQQKRKRNLRNASGWLKTVGPAQAQVSRHLQVRMGIYLAAAALQPRAHAESGPVADFGCVSSGRSVPERRKPGRFGRLSPQGSDSSLLTPARTSKTNRSIRTKCSLTYFFISLLESSACDQGAATQPHKSPARMLRAVASRGHAG